MGEDGGVENPIFLCAAKGIEPRSECGEFTGYDTFAEYAPFTN